MQHSTADFILSRVRTFHDNISPIDIGPVIQAVTFYAMHNSGTEMARNAAQALLSVVKLNENICFFDTEVAVFDSAIDEYLSTRRTETGNPDYPN